jgi:hypothetical protein
MVQHSTQNPEIEGSNPTPGTGRDKMENRGKFFRGFVNIMSLCAASTLVEHLTTILGLKGLNQTPGTGRD